MEDKCEKVAREAGVDVDSLRAVIRYFDAVHSIFDPNDEGLAIVAQMLQREEHRRDVAHDLRSAVGALR